MARKTSLTFEEKSEVLNLCNAGMNKKQICSTYNISKRTLYRIKKDKMVIMNKQNEEEKKQRRSKFFKYKPINEFLVKVIKECNENYIPINYRMIKDLALEFAQREKIRNFKASNSWVESFKTNSGISFVNIVGEAGSGDFSAAQESKRQFKCNKNYNFRREDIFNLDETSLFYKRLPAKTIKISNSKITGLKLSKERISVCLLCNEKSEKLPILIIGKSKNPRSLKNKNLSDLNVIYKNNKNAWMTSEILNDYLASINQILILKERNILILMDNCPAHRNLKNFSNIKICYIPPNTSSLIQPLDQGIINTFKVNYKRIFMYGTFCYSNIKDFNKNVKKYSLFDAIINSALAWKEITSETFLNCFKGLYEDYDAKSEDVHIKANLDNFLECYNYVKDFSDDILPPEEYLNEDNKDKTIKVLLREVGSAIYDKYYYKNSTEKEVNEKYNYVYDKLEELKVLVNEVSPKSLMSLAEFEVNLKMDLNKKE